MIYLDDELDEPGLLGWLVENPVARLVLQTAGRGHAELLAWFFEALPDAGVRALFRWVAHDGNGWHHVSRSAPGADLSVKLPGLRWCHISADVLNVPSERRAERMSRLVQPGDPGELLLFSFIDPGWDEGVYWTPNGTAARWVDYRTFATALDDAVSTLDGFEFERVFVERYCHTVMELGAAIEALDLHDVDEPIPIWHGSYTATVLKIRAAVDRLRMHRARSMLLDMLAHAGRTSIDVVSERGKPVLQQSRQLATGDWIGWQFTGTQWRQFVRTQRHQGTSTAARRERESYARQRYASWFEALFQLAPGLSVATPQGLGYQAQDPDRVAHTVDIGPLSTTAVAQLADGLMGWSYEEVGE